MARDVSSSGEESMRSGYLSGRAARAVAGIALAAATVAATVTATVAVTVPASAGDFGGGAKPTPPDPWPDTVSCATGAFTGHTSQPPTDPSGSRLVLSGWAQQCPGEKNGEPRAARFGFAYMRPGIGSGQGLTVEGVMHDRRLFVYEYADAPTPWSGRFDLYGTGGYHTEAPLCLMANEKTRVACVRVSIGGAPGTETFTVTPIPLDDPAVAHERIVFVTGSATSPECGACV
jgi:hypothetical protein